jgi:hypothetical protein
MSRNWRGREVLEEPERGEGKRRRAAAQRNAVTGPARSSQRSSVGSRRGTPRVPRPRGQVAEGQQQGPVST